MKRVTIVWTYGLSMAAARDAANRQMRQAGRKTWNVDDWNLAVATFDRLHPERNTQDGAAS